MYVSSAWTLINVGKCSHVCARCCACASAELSALLEEDEEGDEARGTAGSGDEAESEGVAMELTGNTTQHTPAVHAGGVPAGQDVTPEFASESVQSASCFW